ncbi:cell division protein anillin-domain-containing protein [Coniochaeta sp. 2T2.1]|nr:cell division protein anillin-domain-containing protein [Coniochaeta sp. 2T2.1]
MANPIPRPLSELSPMEKRRNSPSWNQPSKQKMNLTTDSSPFQSSPLDGTTSPRLVWQNRSFNSENTPVSGRSGSPSPTRRSSIERLQRASRVKNSNILALEQKQEYDPTRVPQIERPLSKVQGNAFGGTGVQGLRASRKDGLGYHRNDSKGHLPLFSDAPVLPKPTDSVTTPPMTFSKTQPSPTKSALSPTRFKSSFDQESGDLSDGEVELPEGRYQHKHAKSVTFDTAPPEVNEYEMATPDISSVGSNSREGSYESEEDEEFDDEHYYGREHDGHEDSFDASLEDTDKTPVVGPDDSDWRQGIQTEYDQSPMPEDLPAASRPQHKRTDSTNSNGDHRPLPPLPGMELKRSNSATSNGLSATAERMLGANRNLPTPPPAAMSKAEMQNIGNGKMTLEERLKLMMLSDDGKTAAEQQRERRMRRAGARDRHGSQTPERELHSPPVQSPEQASPGKTEEEYEAEDTIGDISGLEEYQLPPRISRESILRRVNGNKSLERESDYNFSSPAPSSSPERRPAYDIDPDVPLPSCEDSILEDEDEGSVIINRDAAAYDVDDIPEIYERSVSAMSEDPEQRGNEQDEDIESQYSDEQSLKASTQKAEEDGTSTPRATTPNDESSWPVAQGLQITPRRTDDFRASFNSFMSIETTEDAFTEPKPTQAQSQQKPQTPPLTKPEYDGSGWGDLEDEYGEEPGTPDSVIHHPMPDSDFEDEARDSPAIPEKVATIKSASGSKLKTRPSATPSDLMAMREQRRIVSREVPNIPAIPERHRNRISQNLEGQDPFSASDDFLERHPSFKKRSLTLDLDLGLSLDKDFDRVIEAQKVAFQQLVSPTPCSSSSTQASRQPVQQATSSSAATHTTELSHNANITSRKQRGYLMRQNTKLVAASDKESDEFRGYRSAGNSPVKGTRPESWTVEPWNGNTRQRSLRKRTAVADNGPVPPLPGQESNAVAAASGLKPLSEEDLNAEMAGPDSGERGRLFVKVMGVKDLDLPIPRTWLELARNAPIGQEFELVVPNDLEFQLTLNVKLEKPAFVARKAIPMAQTKAAKPKSVSTFSRVFASPKKRKEMEARQREEEERLQREAQAAAALQQRQAQANAKPTGYDLLSPLVAEDGSFARAYVSLKEHESRCFGRPYLVEVATFNEWAAEEASFASSVKSKRGNNGVVRRAPYKIGKLELQLLFVPRPKGAGDDDMPKSMNSCIREMKAAEERLARCWEGPLSQQGGDCPYWRRRYFKLVGTKLTAYHEATRQPRATINLTNAKRLIDDRRTLTEKETTGRGGKRRKSAFSEEEEGYMFVEEGFRIRFNNGEVIDFYADSTEQKEGWMKALGEVIGRDSLGGEEEGEVSKAKGKWCELVLKREEALKKRAEGRRVHSRTKSMYV